MLADDICQDQRAYDYAKLGMPLNKVAHYVELNYYPDKELLVCGIRIVINKKLIIIILKIKYFFSLFNVKRICNLMKSNILVDM